MAKRKFAALASALKHQDRRVKGKSGPADTKHAVKSRRAPLIPFTTEDDILFLGEGDFSFSASCVEHHLEHGAHVVATSLDSGPLCREKYPDAGTHITTVEECGGTVVHGVDARQLRGPKRYDVVVFMFPHVAAGIADQARNVQTNQKMLLGFFESVQGVLKENGTVAVTLATSKSYELWNIKALAKSAGLVVKTSGAFDGSAFPGYKHARTQGHVKNDAGFSGGKGEERAARWTIFMRAADVKQGQKSRNDSDDNE